MPRAFEITGARRYDRRRKQYYPFPKMTSTVPWLVVDSVEALPGHEHRVRACIRLAGQPCVLALDFEPSGDGFAEFVEIAALLDHYPLSCHTLVDFIRRVRRGHQLEWPVDLSDDALRSERSDPGWRKRLPHGYTE